MPDLAIVLFLLVSAIIMFALGRPRMDAVALIMVVALPLTGVIGIDDALAGFADPNALTRALKRSRGITAQQLREQARAWASGGDGGQG